MPDTARQRKPQAAVVPGAEMANPVADYERVRRILALVEAHWRRLPSVEEMADHVGLSTMQVHNLFRRWAGLTPEAFLEAISLDRARALLRESARALDAACPAGLSGHGRPHDLFVTHEAVPPGNRKAGAEGLAMTFGVHPSPFGETILVAMDRGLAGLGFVDDCDRKAALDDMRRRWPRATFVESAAATAGLAHRIFERDRWRRNEPLRVVLIGTDFEIDVWQSLLAIPVGRATTYSAVAARLGKPKAARAVGAAVGKNPISFVVPCHRVLGRSGALTGYYWGLTRKQAILVWEAGAVGV